MKIQFKKSKRICEIKDIQTVERLIDFQMPHDYVDFLKVYNGAVPTINNIFKIPNVNNDSDIRTFFDIQEIASLVTKRMKNRFPNKVIPIAYDSCGNYICISFEEGKEGIYFWDHELEADEDESPTWDNMFFLSRSFSGFLEMLEEFDLDKYR